MSNTDLSLQKGNMDSNILKQLKELNIDADTLSKIEKTFEKIKNMDKDELNLYLLKQKDFEEIITKLNQLNIKLNTQNESIEEKLKELDATVKENFGEKFTISDLDSLRQLYIKKDDEFKTLLATKNELNDQAINLLNEYEKYLNNIKQDW